MLTFVGGLVVVLVLGLHGMAQAEPEYTLIDLGTQAHLVSVEPDGAALGTLRDAAGDHAAVFRRGQPPTLLPALQDGRAADAAAGLGGAVVGQAGAVPGIGAHAVLWEQGGVRDLGTLGHATLESAALAVSHTLIAGWCSTPRPIEILPCRWTRPAGAAQALPTLGGSFGEVRGISETGILVGVSWAPRVRAHATLWLGGLPIDLTPESAEFSSAYAVNAQTIVVGRLGQHAMRWSPEGGLEDLGLLTGDVWATLLAVNRHGIAVGMSLGAAEHESASKAIRTQGTRLEDLNPLVDLPEHWHVVEAVGISDGGIIGGRAVVLQSHEYEEPHAVLLIPHGERHD